MARPFNVRSLLAQYLANRAGGGAGGGSFLPLAGSALVNPAASDAADDGDTSTPFLTIEGADAAKPAAPTSAADGGAFVILIAPGDYPGADLVLDVDRQTVLLGLGPFGIGSFDGGDRSPSGARRSVIVTAAGSLPDGLRPGLAIYSLIPLGDAMTTHQSYMLKPRISGSIDFTGCNGAGSVEFSFSGEVFGSDSSPTGDAMIGDAAIVQSYLKYSRFRGTVIGSNWQFQVAESCRFTGLVNVGGYSRLARSRLDSGFASVAAPAGIEPSGFIACRFAGTFTGPAAFRLDAYTNWSFKANGGTLAGGAVKLIMGDLDADTWLDFAAHQSGKITPSNDLSAGSTIADGLFGGGDTQSSNSATAGIDGWGKYAVLRRNNTDVDGRIGSNSGISNYIGQIRLLPVFLYRSAPVLAANARHWIGFSGALDLDAMAGADAPLSDYLGFQRSAARGDVNWQFVRDAAAGGGSQVILDTGVPFLSSGEPYYFGIEWTAGGASATVSIRSADGSTVLYTQTVTTDLMAPTRDYYAGQSYDTTGALGILAVFKFYSGALRHNVPAW